MTRRVTICFGCLWALAVGAIVAAFVSHVEGLSHAYVAAWLLLISFPIGALPVLMVLDLAGVGETGVTAALRLLLGGLPILAVLIAPVLFDGRHLYALGEPVGGFAAHWHSPGFFIGRSVIYLLVWIGLSAFFVRREPRRSIAGFGLLVHLVVGTLAAYDWFMSLDVGFVSSAYGILVMVAQSALALTAASIVAHTNRTPGAPDRTRVVILLALVGGAAFIQFSQYLVVWSANLPKEIVWYQARASDGFGPAFAIAGPLLLASAAIVLMPERLGMRRLPVMLALVAMFVVEVIDIVLLASPSTGFTFAHVLLDLPFMIALAGLAGLCAIVVAGSPWDRVPHG